MGCERTGPIQHESLIVYGTDGAMDILEPKSCDNQSWGRRQPVATELETLGDVAVALSTFEDDPRNATHYNGRFVTENWLPEPLWESVPQIRAWADSLIRRIEAGDVEGMTEDDLAALQVEQKVCESVWENRRARIHIETKVAGAAVAAILAMVLLQNDQVLRVVAIATWLCSGLALIGASVHYASDRWDVRNDLRALRRVDLAKRKLAGRGTCLKPGAATRRAAMHRRGRPEA